MADAEITPLRKQLASLVIGVVLLSILGLGVYFFVSALLTKLNALSSDLAKAIVAGAVTLFAAIVTVVLGKIWEQRTKIQADLRERKIPVYEQQIATFFQVLFAQKQGKAAPSEQEIQKAFLEFTQKLIVWGGPEVIRAWSDFRAHNWSGGTPAQGFARLDALLKAIRKELGNSNAGLKPGELMMLFITPEPTPEQAAAVGNA